MKKQILVIILLAVLAVSCLVLTACAHTHKFGEWIVEKEATCTQAGQRERVCSCGEKETEIIPATGHNYEDNVCSDCGDTSASTGLMYELSDDGTCYIVTGVGSCYGENNIVIPSIYNGKAVKHIGDYAFESNEYLEKITIPNTVISIGEDAFSDCDNLTKVIFEEDSELICIGTYAFCDCTNLKSIQIPESVTTIESYAFYGCTVLNNVTLPSKVTIIEEATFAFCSSLTSITLHSNIKALGVGAFFACTGLTNFTIPASVTSLDNNVFDNCSRLISVTFEDPNGWFVTTIQGATSGTSLILTKDTQNAAYLTDTYLSYYWYKK